MDAEYPEMKALDDQIQKFKKRDQGERISPNQDIKKIRQEPECEDDNMKHALETSSEKKRQITSFEARKSHPKIASIYDEQSQSVFSQGVP